MNTFKCNSCRTGRCKMSLNGMKGLYDSSKCKLNDSHTTFKMPILTQLLTNQKKVSDTQKLLSEFGFKVKELDRYPYFRLRI